MLIVLFSCSLVATSVARVMYDGYINYKIEQLKLCVSKEILDKYRDLL